MPVMFSGKELLEIAIQIEKNGFAYYSNVAHAIEDAEAKNLIIWLAEEEKNHIKRFEEISTRFKAEEPDMSPAELEEYLLYIRALAGARVFTTELKAREAALEIRSEKDAIEMAIEFEKDSLLFLNGMRMLVMGSDTGIVEELQKEEMSHLRKLVALKEKG